MTKVVLAKTSCKSASAKLIDERLEKAFDDHIYIAYDALYNDYGVTEDCQMVCLQTNTPSSLTRTKPI